MDNGPLIMIIGVVAAVASTILASWLLAREVRKLRARGSGGRWARPPLATRDDAPASDEVIRHELSALRRRHGRYVSAATSAMLALVAVLILVSITQAVSHC